MRNLKKDEIEMAAKREAMLTEGFRLFSQKGIEPVTMQEIADASKVGVATLYRYYNTKLALVIDIGTRMWMDYSAFAKKQREEKNTDSMTAAQEFEFYLDFFFDLYRNHKDLLCFNQNFNNYVQHEGATQEQLQPYIEAIGTLAEFFHNGYIKGQADGTLRTDMAEDKMFATTSHIMLAGAVRYAQGLLYSSVSETDRTEEYELLKKMILREFIVQKKN